MRSYPQLLIAVLLVSSALALPARAQNDAFSDHISRSNQAFLNKNYELAEQEMLAAEKLTDSTSDRASSNIAVLVRKAQLYIIKEKYAEAEQVLKQAMQLLSEQKTAGSSTALVLDFTLGTVYIKQKRYEEAISAHLHGFPLFSQAATPEERLIAKAMAANFNPLFQHFGRDPRLGALLTEQLAAFDRMGLSEDTYVAIGNLYLGDIAGAENKVSDSETAYKKARDIFDKKGDEVSSQGCSMKLFKLYLLNGRMTDAEQLLNGLLARAEEKGGPNDMQYGKILLLQGRLYTEWKKLSQAEEKLKRAKEILERNPNSEAMCGCLASIMMLNLAQDKPIEAAQAGERAVAIIPRLENELDEDMVVVFEGLAAAYSRQHRYAEAQAQLKRAMSIAEKQNPNGTAVAEVALAFSLQYLDQGDYVQSEEYAQKSLQLWQKIYGYMSVQSGDALINLGNIYRDQGQFEKAGKMYIEGAGVLSKAKTADDAALAKPLRAYAISLGREGNFWQADKTLSRALEIQEKCFGAESEPVADSLFTLSSFSFDAGKYDVAETRGLKALAMDEKLFGPKSAEVARDAGFLYRTYLKLANQEKANAMKSRYLQIKSTLPGAPSAVIADSPVVKADASTALPKQAQPIQDKWALVIGISNFEDTSLNLKYAAKDARDFAHFLTSDGRFAADHVKLLVDQNANRETIVNALGKGFLGSAKKGDLVVIYVSSHGGTDAKGTSGLNFLVPYDADLSNLLTKGIPMEWFSQILQDQIHSERVLVFLDVCHSGAATGGKGLNRERNFDGAKLEPGKGQIIVCSSLANQLSWESKNYDNSVFTRRLIDALRIQGDKTKLGDAFEAMRAKVEDEVLTDRHEEQTPIMKRTWNGDDITLASPPVVSDQSKHAVGE